MTLEEKLWEYSATGGLLYFKLKQNKVILPFSVTDGFVDETQDKPENASSPWAMHHASLSFFISVMLGEPE